MVIDRLYPLLERLARPLARWIIIGLHLALLGGLLFHQGILTDKEALKYTGCAEAVLRGDFSDLTGNYLKYGSYVLFLLPFVAVEKVSLAVVAQILLGIIAADALARLTERITRNVGIGQLAFALFLLCPLIQTWTLALYTEHFFTCMVILFLERVERVQRMDVVLILFGVLALFARPVGLFFVVPAFLWKMTAPSPSWLKPWLMPLGCTALFLFAIHVPRVAPAQLQPIATGQIIAGVGGIEATDFSGHTIAAAQRHLSQRTSLAEWTGITVQRMASLFTLTRPHYSSAHNAVNAVFYLLFPLALAGLWRWKNDQRVRLIRMILILNTLLVSMTHDEWSGRFLVPLLPLIIVCACFGITAHRSSVHLQV